MSEPVIELKDCKIYQQKHLILHDVNLTMEPGEFIYLVGETGTGKSSLLKTLYGELPLTEGTGNVAGYNLRKLGRSKIPYLRRKLGIVFQDFQLLTDRSVAENLLFVLRATGWKKKTEMKAKIEEVLEQTNLATKSFKMPQELSGGEQQRVAIARALLNSPEVILADEPTGNLDPANTTLILKLLYDISLSGTTVILATHDYEYLDKFGSRLLRCADGQVHDSKKASA